MGQVANKFQMTRDDNIFYAKRCIVDSIYSEARLEGISATYPETKEIFEGRAVAGLSVDETIAINNLKHAWQFVFDNIDSEIDLPFIRQANGTVGKGIVADAGNLRMVDVRIGGTSWKPDVPSMESVKADLESIQLLPKGLDKALELFVWICRSQLFLDGNKRTAQIVANALMIQDGLGILSIPVESKPEWERLLIEYYETGDASELKEFLYENAIDGYDTPTRTNP